MAKTVVHMIGQAHLDPVWLWRWTEGRAEALATSRSAVDRLNEHADFHFTRGEAQVYRWIEEEDPALFAEIVRLIRDGRWHVVNGMIVQPDMNLPQGESFVRHFLLGKAYMIEHLGVEPHVAYCVDSFGHAGTLPQIFIKCGCDCYVFMRPGPHEKDLPSSVFWWQGPDGSRVLAFRIAATYGTPEADHTAHIEATLREKPAALDHTMCFFGVGNHGGGPTRAQIENVKSIAAERQDVEIRFSSTDAYFTAIKPQASVLSIVADELQYHAIGCYSANSALKRAHRQAECELLVAERMAALAQLWVRRPVPQERLNELWWMLCFHQFHDILGGCTIKEAADEALMALGGITLGARKIANDAGRAIAAQVDTRGPGGAFILFNPFPYPLDTYVQYEPWTEWQAWDAGSWGLVDECGQPVIHQPVEASAAAGSNGLTRLIFHAQLPPLGYRTYHFAPRLPRGENFPAVHADPTGLQNDRLIVRLDPSNGQITSCVDRVSGLEWVGDGGWNVAQVLEDTSDTWAHGVRCFEEAGRGVIGLFEHPKITVCEAEGSLRASLLVERRFGSSYWLQQIALYAGKTEIVIHNWLFWQGQWRTVKLAFDVAVDGPRAFHDVPFGWLERLCDGAEVPVQMWSDVRGYSNTSDTEHLLGLAVLNDGKYACDVNGSTLRVTILRSPPYAYHIPHILGSKRRYDWLDQGLQEFTLVLRPHIGDWRDAGIVQRARELNLPPVTITTHSHPGSLPAVGSWGALNAKDLEITALKAAQDGHGYIVRLADQHGRGGQGDLLWQKEKIPLSLNPFEVTTLRLSRRNGRWHAECCDMLERPEK